MILSDKYFSDKYQPWKCWQFLMKKFDLLGLFWVAYVFTKNIYLWIFFRMFKKFKKRFFNVTYTLLLHLSYSDNSV